MTNLALDTASPHASTRATLRAWTILLLLAFAGAALRYAVYRFGLNGGSFGDFIASLCRWDCGWYRSVARGYNLPLEWKRQGEANWAFFPLYPLLVRIVQFTGASWELAGFLLSNIFGVLAAAAARPLLRSERAYWLFAFGLLLGPFSYLFSLPYTESLFILLTILALRALLRSDYLTAGAWGALLSATRVTGIFIGLAILAQAIQDRLREGMRPADVPPAILKDRRLLLAGLLVPIGLVAFMLHLKLLTGDGLAFTHVVPVGWGRVAGNPIAKWWDVFGHGWPFTRYFGTQTTHAWIGAIGVLLAVVLAARGRWAAGIFCFAALMLSMSAGLDSLTRYTVGLVPLGFPIAEAIARSRWATWLAYPIALAFGLAVTAGWLLDWNLLV